MFKRKLRLFLEILFLIFGSYSIYPNSFDCSPFFSGEFYYILDGVETKAIRKKGYQEIFKKINGHFIKDSIESIEWTDECSFKTKIIDTNSPVQKWLITSGLLFTIISIEGNSYIYQAYQNRSPYYSGKVTKVKD